MEALNKNLNDNISYIKGIFNNDVTLVTRYIENQNDQTLKFCALYIDGMVDNKLLSEVVIKPLMIYKSENKSGEMIDIVANQIVYSDSSEKTNDMNKITQSVVYGDTILLVEGSDNALILNTKGWVARAVTEPENEKIIKGPREGFNESIMMNLSQVRRKIRNPELKMEFRTFGDRTKTNTCICYIDNLVNKNVLDELRKRLDKVSLDGVIDSNYICEYVCDTPLSPFKTIGSTERPDIVAAKMLEGRVALFVDGTPVVLTLPYLFIENFQSNEDYYINYFFANISRMIRLLGFFISTSVPAIYLSFVTFHHELLPSHLTISISAARQDVPLPTVIEILAMLVVFEILRETGTRSPMVIGQALGIVGALIIGQAAVQARLVSAPIIIIVAVSGVTGLMLYRIKGGIIIIRFLLVFLSAMIGLYGFIFGVMGILLYVINLRSFGVPVLSSTDASGLHDLQDVSIRSPWWFMKYRPKFVSSDDVRSGSDGDQK